MTDIKKLDDSDLNKISGGRTLPDNWEDIAKKIEPFYLKMYGKLTYEQACKKLEEYFSDEEDLAILRDYIKKFYPEFEQQEQ